MDRVGGGGGMKWRPEDNIRPQTGQITEENKENEEHVTAMQFVI